jgi:hypothetical protein
MFTACTSLPLLTEVWVALKRERRVLIITITQYIIMCFYAVHVCVCVAVERHGATLMTIIASHFRYQCSRDRTKGRCLPSGLCRKWSKGKYVHIGAVFCRNDSSGSQELLFEHVFKFLILLRYFNVAYESFAVISVNLDMFKFDTELVYTFDFYQHILDISSFMVANLISFVCRSLYQY